jgi:hypothetical protein
MTPARTTGSTPLRRSLLCNVPEIVPAANMHARLFGRELQVTSPCIAKIKRRVLAAVMEYPVVPVAECRIRRIRLECFNGHPIEPVTQHKKRLIVRPDTLLCGRQCSRARSSGITSDCSLHPKESRWFHPLDFGLSVGSVRSSGRSAGGKCLAPGCARGHAVQTYRFAESDAAVATVNTVRTDPGLSGAPSYLPWQQKQ